MKRNVILLTAFATLMIVAIQCQPASADHDRYSNPAAAIVSITRDLNDTFRQQFRDSRLYGPLQSTAHRIRGKANYLQSRLRAGSSCGTTTERYMDQIDALICEMETLVAEARRRSAQGFEPPLYGCTLHVDAKIETMRCAMRELRQILSPPVYHYGYGGSCGGSDNDDYYYYSNPYGQIPQSYNRHGSNWYGNGYGNSGIWLGDQGSGRGVSLDQNGISLQSGNFSIRFNR